MRQKDVPRISIKMRLIKMNIRVSALKKPWFSTFKMPGTFVKSRWFWVWSTTTSAEAKMARYTSMELARGQDFNRILASNDENPLCPSSKADLVNSKLK